MSLPTHTLCFVLLAVAIVAAAAGGEVRSPSRGGRSLPLPLYRPSHRGLRAPQKDVLFGAVPTLKPEPKSPRRPPRCSNPLRILELTTGVTVTFQTPGYPRKYPRNTLCGWVFQTLAGLSIELNCTVSLKPNDFLHIYDYSTEELESIDAEFMASVSRSYDSTAIAVLLQSDRRRQGQGFRCEITVTTPTETTTPSITTPTVPTTQTPTVPTTQPPPTVPTSQPPTVPTSQPPTVPTSQTPTVPTTQPPPTVPTSQPPTVPTSQPPTVPTSQPPTVPTSQPPTVPTSQPPTVPTSQPPTVPTSQPPTVPSSQPPTTPTTQPPMSDCQCGVKQASRIVGGEEASVDEYPWMVSLGVGYNEQFCGGTLISDSWIVTAAHCISDDMPQNPGKLRVGLGFHSLAEPSSSSIARTARAVIPHPNYNERTLNNDIALILIDPIDWQENPTIRPACLPDNPEDLYVGSPGIVTGWGALESGGRYPEKLMEVSIPIISNAECESSLGTPIPPQMVCAGVPQGGIDSCQGDSGGPMVVMDGINAELVGAVSWGYGCAEPASPGVYARVTEFLPWIESNTAGSEYCPRV